MIAMASLLLALSVAGNVFQLYIHGKKPKPKPKQLGPAPQWKGLLGEEHVLESLYMGTTTEHGKRWFFVCSCGASYTTKNCTNEAKGIELWQHHVSLYKALDPDSELARLKKELEELNTNCICKDL